MEYVTLDAAGINGRMYGGVDERVGVTEGYVPPSRRSAIRENFTKNMFYDDAVFGCQSLEKIHDVTGQFGQNNFRSEIDPTCPSYSYESAMAEVAQQQRDLQMINHGARAQSYRDASMS